MPQKVGTETHRFAVMFLIFLGRYKFDLILISVVTLLFWKGSSLSMPIFEKDFFNLVLLWFLTHRNEMLVKKYFNFGDRMSGVQ